VGVGGRGRGKIGIKETRKVKQENTKRNPERQGHLVVQSVKCLILDCGSGHDLGVVRLSPTLGLV